MLTKSHSQLCANLFKNLSSYQLSYVYHGDFNIDLTERILSLVESSMDDEKETSKTKKKVYFIMVESLQNITRHQAENNRKKLQDGFFSIHKFDEGYLVTSGNVVENKNIELLKQKLEKVNSLDADQLKQYYYDVLNLGGFSEKGGAGLGLIEMVRKSGNRLVYEFVELDEEFSYFYFQANIASGSNELAPPMHSFPPVEKLNVVKGVHEAVKAGNFKTVFFGQFGHDNVKRLLSITEDGIAASQNVELKKSIVSVMIELLQNICYHGYKSEHAGVENPGLFLVSDDNVCYELTTVNYIESSKIDSLSASVNKINKSETDSLETLFMEVIKEEEIPGKKGAGLGLIDIRLRTKNKVEVNFIPATESLSYIIVKTKIKY
jgi:hypothetical protein